MAITIVDRGTTQQLIVTATTLATTSATFSPADGAVIVGCARVRVGGYVGIAPTFTDTFTDVGGIAWTQCVEEETDGTESVAIWTRKIGYGAGSGAVRAATPQEGLNWQRAIGLTVAELGNVTTPVPAQFGSLYDTTTSNAFTFDATPATDSIVFTILWAGDGCPAPSAPSGYTLLASDNPNSDSYGVAYQNGSAPAGITWSGLTGAIHTETCAVEIAAGLVIQQAATVI